MNGVIGSFVRCDVRVMVLAAVRILVVAVVRELVRRVVGLVCTVAAKFDAVCVASGVANCEVGRLCLDAYPTRVSIHYEVWSYTFWKKKRIRSIYRNRIQERIQFLKTVYPYRNQHPPIYSPRVSKKKKTESIRNVYRK